MEGGRSIDAEEFCSEQIIPNEKRIRCAVGPYQAIAELFPGAYKAFQACSEINRCIVAKLGVSRHDPCLTGTERGVVFDYDNSWRVVLA